MGRKSSTNQASNKDAAGRGRAAADTSSQSTSFATNSLNPGQSLALPQGAGKGREAAGNARGGRNGGETPGWPLALPHSSKQVTSQHDLRQLALDVYSKIGTKFNSAYDSSVTQAMRNLLMDLRANQRLLVEGGLYTARELDDRVDQLQQYLKVGGDEGKTTMEDRFHQWLNQPDQEPEEA